MFALLLVQIRALPSAATAATADATAQSPPAVVLSEDEIALLLGSAAAPSMVGAVGSGSGVGTQADEVLSLLAAQGNERADGGSQTSGKAPQL